MPKANKKPARLACVPTPANDPTNIIKLAEVRAARADQQRRANLVDRHIPPERALLIALIQAQLITKKRDQRSFVDAILRGIDQMEDRWGPLPDLSNAKVILTAAVSGYVAQELEK